MDEGWRDVSKLGGSTNWGDVTVTGRYNKLLDKEWNKTFNIGWIERSIHKVC